MGQQRVVEQLNVSQLLEEGELIAPVDDIIDAHWCTFTPSRIDLDQPNLLWDILRTDAERERKLSPPGQSSGRAKVR
jgi:hypothetical protein